MFCVELLYCVMHFITAPTSPPLLILIVLWSKTIVTHIDDAGQIHGTLGGCALIPEIDACIILKRA